MQIGTAKHLVNIINSRIVINNIALNRKLMNKLFTITKISTFQPTVNITARMLNIRLQGRIKMYMIIGGVSMRSLNKKFKRETLTIRSF